MHCKTLLRGTLLAVLAAWGISASAQLSNTVKIGVLTDMSGPYSAMGGVGSVVAAKMAVDDCLKAECKGMKIEVVSADNQNKADVGVTKAREWIDRDGVTAIADLTNSSVALAVARLSREKGVVAMYSGPATNDLTGKECSPTGFHWMFDSYSQAVGTAAALTKLGDKSWFFLTVDYAFGHSLEKNASEVIKKNGGNVVGQVLYPLNSGDLSAFLLQAKNSKAQVLGLANAGQDVVNAIKQAHEFGIGGKDQMKIAALLVFLSDVHALGLPIAQGLIYTDGFYWDYDKDSRAFSKRFVALNKGNEPTMVQGGVYSSVYHYLKAVAASKSTDGKVVAQKMRELPIKDPIMHNASIRPDGRVIHDMYLMQVKTPAESKGPWDYEKVLATIPAQEAFKPMDKACNLVK